MLRFIPVYGNAEASCLLAIVWKVERLLQIGLVPLRPGCLKHLDFSEKPVVDILPPAYAGSWNLL